uniref:ZP domain-containing protein n=1 Tax=Xiphophorus couchianus TaxID=32473 RepID=A0A3B5LBC7_9TELE
VLCGRDFMSIRAAEDFFSYLKVPLESLHLPNRSCRAQREVIAGTPFFMFRTSREKYLACGGKPLQKNSTHLLYSLTVQSEPQVSGNVIRDPAIKMDFTCVYPNLRRVSLPFPVQPISGPNGRSSGVRFRFQMFRFTAGPAEFYLHCSVQLCEPDDQPSCLPLLSYGPIRVKVPDQPVSVLSAAVLPVAAVWTLGFFLTLLIIVAKAG